MCREEHRDTHEVGATMRCVAVSQDKQQQLTLSERDDYNMHMHMCMYM